MIRTAVIGREGLPKLPQTFQIIGQDRESPALARQRFHANHLDRFSPAAAAPGSIGALVCRYNQL